jgi:hypothetical protein
MVSIYGTFPSQVYVWFDDQPGDLLFQSSGWILVAAPPRSEPGPVDIGLRSPSAGTVLLVRDGFTYTGSDPASGATTTTTVRTTTTATITTTTIAPGITATTTTTSGASPSTTSRSGATSTTSGTPTTGAPAQSTTTTSGGGGQTRVERVSRALTLGGPVDLGGGLQGVALQGFGSLGDVPHCASDPCRTRRI